MWSTLLGAAGLLAMTVCSGLLLHVQRLPGGGAADLGRFFASAVAGAPYLLAVLLSCGVALARGGLATLWPAGAPGLRGLLLAALALCAAATVVAAAGLPGLVADAATQRQWIAAALAALLLLALGLGIFPALAGGRAPRMLAGAWALLLAMTLVAAGLLVQQALAGDAARRAAREREIPGLTAPRTRVWQRTPQGWAYDGKPFQAADAATLQPLDGEFARDAVQGYYRGQPVPGSHGPSFEALGENQARDHRSVYWAQTYRRGQDYWLVQHIRIETMEVADPARYEVLRYGHGRDDRHAYRDGQRLRKVRDGASFEALTREIGRDARRGYYDGTEIPGSDGASFEIIDRGRPEWVRDRRQAWHLRTWQPERGGELEREIRLLAHADPAALRPLGNGYASDGRRVWHGGQRVEDADAGSFVVLDTTEGRAVSQDHPPDARDARGPFRNGRRIDAGSAQPPR